MSVSYNRLWKQLIDKNMKRIETSLGSVVIFLPGWEKINMYQWKQSRKFVRKWIVLLTR
jgi:hypothetical protein